MKQISLEEFIPDEASRKALFKTLMELEERRITFLFGGMTAINCILGLIRFSQDIDIFLEQGMDRFVHEIFTRHGFKGKHRRISEFSTLSFNNLRVDIIGSKTFPVTETLLQQPCPKITFMNRTFPTMPVEDTVLAKLERNSARDVYDIEQILQHHKMDMPYTRKRAAETGKPHLLERLEEL